MAINGLCTVVLEWLFVFMYKHVDAIGIAEKAWEQDLRGVCPGDLGHTWCPASL